MHRAALAILASCLVAATASAQDFADWQGVWIAEGLTADISGFPPPGARWYKLYGDEAPWNDEGRRRFEAMISNQATLKADGWGFPMMMDSAAPMQFLVTPDETLIVNIYRDIRVIHTDGRAMPSEDERWPTTWGTSVGRWEGDTLVVETQSVRNPTRFFFSSPPLSEQARYVERLRKAGPGRIESVMTIEDPVTLAEPWVVTLSYVPAGSERLILDDYANDRLPVVETTAVLESASAALAGAADEDDVAAAEGPRLGRPVRKGGIGAEEDERPAPHTQPLVGGLRPRGGLLDARALFERGKDRPVRATGAALLCDGEVFTVGDVPASTGLGGSSSFAVGLRPQDAVALPLREVLETLSRRYGQAVTIALAKRLTLAVANDAGVGHMLAAANCPLVSLFGPTPPDQR